MRYNIFLLVGISKFCKKSVRMFDSIFPNRFKEDDESPIVENDSLEDGVAALEITQAEGRNYPGIIVHG